MSSSFYTGSIVLERLEKRCLAKIVKLITKCDRVIKEKFKPKRICANKNSMSHHKDRVHVGKRKIEM